MVVKLEMKASWNLQKLINFNITWAQSVHTIAVDVLGLELGEINTDNVLKEKFSYRLEEKVDSANQKISLYLAH